MFFLATMFILKGKVKTNTDTKYAKYQASGIHHPNACKSTDKQGLFSREEVDCYMCNCRSQVRFQIQARSGAFHRLQNSWYLPLQRLGEISCAQKLESYFIQEISFKKKVSMSCFFKKSKVFKNKLCKTIVKWQVVID